MELRQLEYVVAVARHRNFTAAAKSLLVAQPALSVQIRNLERELGVALFERTTRRVRLTRAGEDFLGHADSILAEVRLATRELAINAGVVRGVVRIGAWFSLNRNLPVVLAAFAQEHPGVSIEIREENAEAALDMIRAGELDVALVTVCNGLNFESIDRSVYVREPFVLEVAPSADLPSDHEVSLEDIADLPLITHKVGSALRRVIEDAYAAIGRTPRVSVETNQTSAVQALVAAGIGAALVPVSFTQLPGPPVRIIRIAQPPIRTSAIVWHATNQTPVTEAFVSFARTQLAPTDGVVGQAVDVEARHTDARDSSSSP